MQKKLGNPVDWLFFGLSLKKKKESRQNSQTLPDASSNLRWREKKKG